MKKIILFSLLVISCFAFGQKIKTKNGIVSIDGKDYLKVKEDPVSNLCYTLSSLNGKDLFYLKFNNYKDTKEVDYTYNKEGNVYYYEVISGDLNTIYFEYKAYYTFRAYDDIVKILYSGNAINPDGTINESNLDILSKKIGFEFSRKREELKNANNNSTQTIIIQDERPKNGVNISIGR